MQSILITGAAGFIGFHLIEKLRLYNYKIIGLDNLNSYYPTDLKHRRLEINKNPNYKFYYGDICDESLVNYLYEKYKPGITINLAAMAGVTESLKNPGSYINSNLLGFFNIIEACRHYNSKLIYASSSSVYGGLQKYPSRESDFVDQPISLYAATKKSNELIAHTYSNNFKLQTIGLRFFTVFGEEGRPDMAIWKFVEKIYRDLPLEVYNYGKLERDFTSVEDIVDGIINCIFSSHKLNTYEVFNLGNNHPVKILNLVYFIGKRLGKKPKINLKKLPLGDLSKSYSDLTLSQSKIGFKPRQDFWEKISQFIEWYQNNPEIGELIYNWRVSKDS